MKQTKILPATAFAMCVPGIVFRALHFLNGFDVDTGLPITGTHWMSYCIVLLLVCAVVYIFMSLPLRTQKDVPFEQLMGTDSPAFRMLAALAGVLLVAGGCFYFYSTMTLPTDESGWTRIFEFIYSAFTVFAGASCVGLAKAQTETMTENRARLTLVPLFWSCLHLLVNYRMTCIDPKLPSFAFGLVSDILVLVSLYCFARLLYSKPNPAALGVCCALAVTSAVTDLGGYALAWVMGVRTVNWSMQMVLRSVLTVSMCLFLAAELVTLVRESDA